MTMPLPRMNAKAVQITNAEPEYPTKLGAGGGVGAGGGDGPGGYKDDWEPNALAVMF
jgi:hypothetical protein